MEDQVESTTKTISESMGVRGAGCGVRGAGCGVRSDTLSFIAGCGVRGAGCGVIPYLLLLKV